jgi:hypothetical protein
MPSFHAFSTKNEYQQTQSSNSAFITQFQYPSRCCSFYDRKLWSVFVFTSLMWKSWSNESVQSMNNKDGNSVFQSSAHVPDLHSHIQCRNAHTGFTQNLHLIPVFLTAFAGKWLLCVVVKRALIVYGKQMWNPDLHVFVYRQFSFLRASPVYTPLPRIYAVL